MTRSSPGRASPRGKIDGTGYDAVREIRAVVREMRDVHRREGGRVVVHWVNRLEAALTGLSRERKEHAARR